jgi:hypothetical protein
VRIKPVQVAIHDPEYADSIRNLLVEDGRRQVYLVERPDVELEGVILIDAARLDDLPLLSKEHERLVVMVRQGGDDLARVWDAGVRHVVFYGDSPHMARTVVLGVELTLASTKVLVH